MQDTVISVSELVAVINQTLEYALPVVTVEGEVSSFKISKNRWVYFDLKDNESSVRVFTSVYQLQTQIEDGMLVKVTGSPKLHQLYGFSLNARIITPSGEGSARRAFELLKAKLEAEGLFEESRKRPIPVYPKRIALIASGESAAYADFMRLVNERWGGLAIDHYEVQVQGEPAPKQIAAAIAQANAASDLADTAVIIRGGGSLEDLGAFNTEQVARAIAQSRIPTIVGVGHEIDTTLADLVSDRRATTPTNAAQIAVPDRQAIADMLSSKQRHMQQATQQKISFAEQRIQQLITALSQRLAAPRQAIDAAQLKITAAMQSQLRLRSEAIAQLQRTVAAYDHNKVLSRGYSLLRKTDGTVVQKGTQVTTGESLMVELQTDNIGVTVNHVETK